MAIVNASLVASDYFVMDLPDIQWTGLSDYDQVTATITITPLNGPQVQFSEAYVPDSDGAVTIRGIAELMQPYVAPSPTELAAINVATGGVNIVTVTRAMLNILITADGQSVGSSPTTYAYYSNQRTNTYPSSIKKWLSRYTDRALYPLQRITASAFLFTGSRIFIRAYYDNDGALAETTGEVSISGGSAAATPTDAVTLCYTIAQAAAIAGCPADSEVYIIDVMLYDGSTKVDSIRYRMDKDIPKTYVMVAFTNCYGMLEIEAMTGNDEINTSLEGTYAWIDDEYEKIDQSEVTEHHLCAGSITDEQRKSLRDIGQSAKVAIVYKGTGSVLAPSRYEPVTVTGQEIKDTRPHTQPQTAYITLRHAPRRHEIVARGADGSASYDDGIFDQTFDNTYN